MLTGVSRGLGRALALHLSAAGHHVWGCSRNSSAIDELSALSLERGRFNVVDVAHDPSVAGWAAEVQGAADSIDLVVNNAAVINSPAHVWKIDAGEFDSVLDVNIKGTANVVRHFLPPMLEQGRGVIVNVISGSGKNCPPMSGAYNTSKWAVEGLTRTLANELPSGLAAVALDPGTIDTAMLRRIIGDRAADYPSVAQWIDSAVNLLLALDATHNGQTISVFAAANNPPASGDDL